ncbi:MAG TPA: CDP-archaeol synthase [Oligoflexia bacterium]|nr:CDP-archaeol synthase [Oligoflexia bacterium]HMP47614.1 CDP-archaeol synthase [Oligoflexia bacterium]
MALNPDFYTSAIFAISIVLIFTFAGIIQVFWLKSVFYKMLIWPLDLGLSFRSKRIFGDNKTVGGIILMWPLTFLMMFFCFLFVKKNDVAPIIYLDNPEVGYQIVSNSDYLIISFIISTGYIAGELLNSLIKRQLGIKPGDLTSNKKYKIFQIIIDQIDSVLFSLILFSLIVRINLVFFLLIVTIGSLVHMLFNVLLFRIGLKSEAR